MSSKKVRGMKWDPDSPRFKQACSNLQISKEDITLRKKTDFEREVSAEVNEGGPDLTKELTAIRYSYHLQSIKDYLNDIIEERNRIILKQKIAEQLKTPDQKYTRSLATSKSIQTISKNAMQTPREY
jgi:hypothetical protein